MFPRIRTIIAAAALVCAAAPGAQAEPPYAIEWARQLGTSETDRSWCVAADPLGNVFISGQALGSLGGPNAGYVDAFVSKYDPVAGQGRQAGRAQMQPEAGAAWERRLTLQLLRREAEALLGVTPISAPAGRKETTQPTRPRS